MAYNLKYYNEFKDYYNNDIRIEILGRDYSGSSTEIKTLATPLILSYPGSDNKIFNPVVGSEITVNILSQTNFQFVSLHNSDARAHRIDIYKESVLDWSGWILPDLFSEPYVAPPYPISVTARCGLGELKEHTVDTEATEISNLGELPTLYDIVKLFLSKIETITTLNECVNIYYDTNDTENDSPFVLTKIEIAAFNDKNYYDTLADILTSFGARIYQQGGEWWLVRVKEIKSTLVCRTWDFATDTFNLDETKLTTFLISRPAGNQIVDESPQLEILPAWKNFKFIQDLGLRESLLENSDFTEWENSYTDRRGDGGITGSTENIRISKWTEGYLGLVERKEDSAGTVYAQWKELIALINPDFNNYLSQTFTNKYVVSDSQQKISIKFEIDLLTYIIGVTTAGICFEVRITGNRYLKVNSSTGLLEWTSTPTKIFVRDIPTTYQSGRNNNRVTPENWKTIDLIAPGFDASGQLEVIIYGGENAVLRIKKATVKIIDVNEFAYPESIETTITINENNIYTGDDIELISGDLPEINNANFIYKHGFRKNDSYPTIEWHERDSSESMPILQLTGKDYKAIYQNPQFKLSVPILSNSIKFDSCIVDYLVLPKKYICASAEYDYQTCIFRGTYMEFGVWEEAVWILEDGTWNDEGIWIDGDEYWQDDNSDVITINLFGEGYHDLSGYLSVTDTILTLPVNAPGMGGVLKENGVSISSVPHVISNANIGIEIGIYIYLMPPFSFNAIVSGTQKTIVLLVA